MSKGKAKKKEKISKKEFELFKAAERINLNSKNLGFKEINDLVKALDKNSKLKVLVLNDNNLGDSSAEAVLSLLKKNPSLQIFMEDNPKITSAVMTRVNATHKTKVVKTKSDAPVKSEERDVIMEKEPEEPGKTKENVAKVIARPIGYDAFSASLSVSAFSLISDIENPVIMLSTLAKQAIAKTGDVVQLDTPLKIAGALYVAGDKVKIMLPDFVTLKPLWFLNIMTESVMAAYCIDRNLLKGLPGKIALILTKSASSSDTSPYCDGRVMATPIALTKKEDGKAGDPKKAKPKSSQDKVAKEKLSDSEGVVFKYGGAVVIGKDDLVKKPETSLVSIINKVLCIKASESLPKFSKLGEVMIRDGQVSINIPEGLNEKAPWLVVKTIINGVASEVFSLVVSEFSVDFSEASLTETIDVAELAKVTGDSSALSDVFDA